MSFCYTSWQTDRYLDEMGKWEQITEAYFDSGEYEKDLAEWIAGYAEENDGEVADEEMFLSLGLDDAIERWHERRVEDSI